MDALNEDQAADGVVTCDDCGEPIPVGGWPWCASDRNPEGHSKGVTYRWANGTPMRKWEKMSR